MAGQKTKTRKAPAGSKKSSSTQTRKPAVKKTARKASASKSSAKVEEPPAAVEGRFAAPRVRLGMTAAEVREAAGAPECILFNRDENVQWQFATPGFDAVGASTIFVTVVTFHMGRVVLIEERISDAHSR